MAAASWSEVEEVAKYHLQQNVQAYVPRKAMQGEVTQELRNIFHAPDLATSQTWLNEIVMKYQSKYTKLADWLELNVPEGLTIFSFPASHHRRIRTVNMLERVSQEIRRRTRVVRIFPNEASCLRLAIAILMKISEDWQTGQPNMRLLWPSFNSGNRPRMLSLSASIARIVKPFSMPIYFILSRRSKRLQKNG